MEFLYSFNSPLHVITRGALKMPLAISLTGCRCPYAKSRMPVSTIGLYENSKARTLAVLDCIERRQMMIVTRKANHCLGCLTGEWRTAKSFLTTSTSLPLSFFFECNPSVLALLEGGRIQSLSASALGANFRFCRASRRSDKAKNLVWLTSNCVLEETVWLFKEMVS